MTGSSDIILLHFTLTTSAFTSWILCFTCTWIHLKLMLRLLIDPYIKIIN